MRTKIGGLITWKRSIILAGSYLGILILLVPMLYLLPNEGFANLIEDRNQAEAQSFNTLSFEALTDLTNHLAFTGDFDQQKGIYKNSNHIFKVDTKKLLFNASANSIVKIFVERKDVDDGEIEVRTYVATQSIGTINFTTLMLPPAISYKNGTLSFMSADRQSLDFRQFNSDFTVAQFKKLNKVVGNGMSSNFEWKIIYIRVPKSLEIDKGAYNGQIQIIESN